MIVELVVCVELVAVLEVTIGVVCEGQTGGVVSFVVTGLQPGRDVKFPYTCSEKGFGA